MSGKELYAKRKIVPQSFDNKTLSWRKRLEKLLKDKVSLNKIVEELKVSRSTIFYERQRMGSLDIPYDAEFAHKDAQEKKKVKKRYEMPIRDKNRLVKAYKIIGGVLEEKIPTYIKDQLIEVKYLLGLLGVEEERFKKPFTTHEKMECERLYREGCTHYRISQLLNRSHTSVSDYLKKIKENKEKEFDNDEFKSKWLQQN